MLPAKNPRLKIVSEDSRLDVAHVIFVVILTLSRVFWLLLEY
jgi:hypothetical protein